MASFLVSLNHLNRSRNVMSGHSKWANIKNRKAAQDKKRSNIFTKLAKDISVAARQGSELDTNFKLRLAVEKARQANMPKDNIERAIKKGAGELGGDIIEEIIYEGFGPEGVAVIVEAATDNKNRTAAFVREIFNKSGGSLGASNSVMWMFDRKGVTKLPVDIIHDKDSFLLEVIDHGAQDVLYKEDEVIIITDLVDFQNVQEYLERHKYVMTHSQLEYLPNNYVEVDEDEALEKISLFVDKMLDGDDIQNVYINVK